MTIFTASEARKRLYNLVDEVKESHVPVQIVGKRNSVVLISEEDWRDRRDVYLAPTGMGIHQKGLKLL